MEQSKKHKIFTGVMTPFVLLILKVDKNLSAEVGGFFEFNDS